MLKTSRLLLHIGSPKTGTTSIQGFLARHAEGLRAHGILYPATGRTAGGLNATAHHQLVRLIAAADGSLPAPLWRSLRFIGHELRQSNCDTLLLSSEDFFRLPRPEVLRRYLSADSVAVICWLRPQYDFLNSCYYTEVTHNKIVDLPLDYLASLPPSRLDYFETLSRWRAAFPQMRLAVSVFDRGSAARRFPVAHFLSEIGLVWPLDPASDNTVEHPTLPALATLFLRRLNEMGWNDRAFFELFQRIHAHRQLFGGERLVYPPGEMHSLSEAWRPLNQRVRQHFMGGSGDLFEEPQLPSPEVWEQAVGDPATAAQRVFLNIIEALRRAD
jgi:hypothetical protein